MLTTKELCEKRAEIYTQILKPLIEKDALSPEDQEKWDKGNKDYDALSAQITRQIRSEAIEKELDSPLERGDSAPPRPGREDRKWEAPPDLDHEDPEEEGDNPEGDPGKEKRDKGKADPKVAPWSAADHLLANPYIARAKPSTIVQALQGWMIARSGQMELFNRAHQRAVRECRVDLASPFFRFYLHRGSYRRLRQSIWAENYEQRAPMTVSTGTGGELIEEDFIRNWEKSLLEFGGMRDVSTVRRTASGAPMPWPTTNDTGNVGALLAINTAATEQVIATGEIVFDAFKYTSKIVLVPMELLQDSAFNLAVEIPTMLAERIARITNTNFTTGTGTGQPNGIVTASSVGVTLPTGNTVTLTYDGFVDLLHSVDPAYRRGPGTGFMMSDAALKAARKIKDTTNMPIWQPGMALAQPDTIFGFPVIINQDIAVPAASAKSVIFGKLSKYVIRDVAEVWILHLKERYAEFAQQAFVSFSRHDGDLLDSGTDPVKHLAQSAT